MNEKTKFIARKEFIVRKIVSEFILVPMDIGHIHLSDGTDLPEFSGIIELNELALFLYNQLETPKTLTELLSAVQVEYDTTHQDVISDIQEFLNTGIKNQIIFIVNE